MQEIDVVRMAAAFDLKSISHTKGSALWFGWTSNKVAERIRWRFCPDRGIVTKVIVDHAAVFLSWRGIWCWCELNEGQLNFSTPTVNVQCLAEALSVLNYKENHPTAEMYDFLTTKGYAPSAHEHIELLIRYRDRLSRIDEIEFSYTPKAIDFS